MDSVNEVPKNNNDLLDQLLEALVCLGIGLTQKEVSVYETKEIMKVMDSLVDIYNEETKEF